jgi:TP901 family phage tail tape measure protein
MSESVFIRLQGRLQAITAEMQRLGAMPAMRNPLAGMNYADYEKRFSKFSDMIQSLKHHLTWMASAMAIGVTFGVPAKTISTIADVEKHMAAMRQVNHDVNESQVILNKTAQDFIGIAQQYGHSVDEIIKAGTLWGRGYKDLNTVMKLTSLTAKLAVADNMDIGLANRAVESVIMSYQKQGQAVQFANHVVDSWTKIAHNAQSSATDLAEALSRTGAAAKAIGVDFDTTNALASAMIKATGRSGAEVGNALKSLFSSIHSNKAMKQLEELGIEMYRVDEQGQKHFRSLHDVFVDLMITSHTTSRNMEKDLLAISGGRRKLAA